MIYTFPAEKLHELINSFELDEEIVGLTIVKKASDDTYAFNSYFSPDYYNNSDKETIALYQRCITKELVVSVYNEMVKCGKVKLPLYDSNLKPDNPVRYKIESICDNMIKEIYRQLW